MRVRQRDNIFWWIVYSFQMHIIDLLKELRHGWCILKHLAYIFQVGRLQSVSIFSIFNHPRSFLLYSSHFVVFLSYQTNILWFPSL